MLGPRRPEHSLHIVPRHARGQPLPRVRGRRHAPQDPVRSGIQRVGLARRALAGVRPRQDTVVASALLRLSRKGHLDTGRRRRRELSDRALPARRRPAHVGRGRPLALLHVRARGLGGEHLEGGGRPSRGGGRREAEGRGRSLPGDAPHARRRPGGEHLAGRQAHRLRVGRRRLEARAAGRRADRGRDIRGQRPQVERGPDTQPLERRDAVRVLAGRDPARACGPR